MEYLKQAAPLQGPTCVSSEHPTAPPTSATPLSGLFHILLQSIFSSLALSHLESFALLSFRASGAQCPDHQHQSPGEPVKIQIPGL